MFRPSCRTQSHRSPFFNQNHFVPRSWWHGAPGTGKGKTNTDISSGATGQPESLHNFYLLTAFIKQNSPWIRHLMKHWFSLVQARDTSGSSRAAPAAPDSGAGRQNCFLLKGRETHKIKALSNLKPTDHWPFLLAFLCLHTRMVSYLSLTVSCSFEQGHTHKTLTSLKSCFYSQLELKQQQTSLPGMENAQCYIPRLATLTVVIPALGICHL